MCVERPKVAASIRHENTVVVNTGIENESRRTLR